MSVSEPATESPPPKLISKQLTSEEPQAQSEEIAAAIHEYVTVYRDPARLLVMHPDDYERVAPRLEQVRDDSVADAAITYRLHDGLDRGAILLSDMDDAAWTSPTQPAS